jgi:hypothetical protein
MRSRFMIKSSSPDSASPSSSTAMSAEVEILAGQRPS